MIPDVVIVGTGPAGVSAATPLVESGLRVLMLDGGRLVADAQDVGSYRAMLTSGVGLAETVLGHAFESLRTSTTGSPKFRVPRLTACFEGYAAHYRAMLEGFSLTGSLASGGLSNAWGAGVAKFDATETSSWPLDRNALEDSYSRISKRIGVSGSEGDALHDLFGEMASMQPPMPLSVNAESILRRARKNNGRGSLRIARSRNAVLTRAADGRGACNLSAMCLWGCARGSIYSASMDLAALLRHPNASHKSFTVRQIRRQGPGYVLSGVGPAGEAKECISATTIVMAAGAVGTTALCLDLLEMRGRGVRLLSTPSAAFAVLLPQRIGADQPESDFGLAQLSFGLDVDGNALFGNMFSTTGIPSSEFVRRTALGQRAGQQIMALLSPAMMLGNLFLPGEFSQNTLSIDQEGRLNIEGVVSEATFDTFHRARGMLGRDFWRCGALVVPGSFTIGVPGDDVHYAGTLPMKRNPAACETNSIGQLAGAEGIYVVDGAALPTLPAKAHTFTIMANADRIGRALVSVLSVNRP